MEQATRNMCADKGAAFALGLIALVLGFASAASAASETVLYSFKDGSDGAVPDAGVTNLNGTLYGTTYEGGASGAGTVYAITPGGAETVLHAFAGGNDGAHPVASLINSKGTLYGTTSGGGASGAGTVFSITPGGTETVIFAFNGANGEAPEAELKAVHGAFYGTTLLGGSATDCNGSCGTVFSITPGGTETVLYSFVNNGVDGVIPEAGLINFKNVLYGTTMEGGGQLRSACGVYGCGTVFSVTRGGTEKVLHAFGKGSDGNSPLGGLINVDGTLYGTTNGGGASGYGTVFSITPAGTETVLYSFTGGNDGGYPTAGLINVNGTLYGTTFIGGTSGNGTVFSITTGGTETVLYSFQGGKDGASPEAGLININGTFYGTTQEGGHRGCYHSGCGTVFAITL